ncbi:High mobility group protein B3 [Tupaia chinensis]|uniref:High mobility group protein B3 n=1 Tax=Tupaia chinensis TaxID=246437 RepID=L8YA43_TUPCH|nr:High mobility group protein B3 [Tupaia chinensis]
MLMVDKVRYDWEMKSYGPAKGGKKKKDPNVHKRPPSGFFLSCSEFCPKIKPTGPGISVGDMAKKLGAMWNNLSDSEKQPCIMKTTELKEKDVAHCEPKGTFVGAKSPALVAAKMVEEQDEEDEERKKGPAVSVMAMSLDSQAAIHLYKTFVDEV